MGLPSHALILVRSEVEETSILLVFKFLIDFLKPYSSRLESLITNFYYTVAKELLHGFSPTSD